MRQDFSWKRSAQLYLELYEKVLAQRTAEIPVRPAGAPSPARFGDKK
jgi:hypothetical protein